MSTYDGAIGDLGSLEPGPELPACRVGIDAALFGCGGVANGWAYAMRRLPVRGKVEAIDKQSLRPENLGPYILSGWPWVGKPKVDLIAQALRPAIQVKPRPEPLEFYKIRLDQGLVRLPGLVVAGLDGIPPRHSVQRFWPSILIDMASGGTTTQLIVHHLGGDGLCLLEALRPPSDAPDFAEAMALLTGLSADRIRHNPTDYINEDDVLAAPLEHQSALEQARRARRLVCGRITDSNSMRKGPRPVSPPRCPLFRRYAEFSVQLQPCVC